MFHDGRTIKQLSVTPFRNQSDDVMGVVASVVEDISTGAAIELLQRFGNIGHWQLDLTSNTLFWSDEVYVIHGLEPGSKMPSLEEAINFYHPDDQREVQRLVQTCVATGEPIQFTLRLIDAHGHLVVVEAACDGTLDENGDPTRLIGIFHKVTERTHRAHLMEQIEEIQGEMGMAFYSYDLVNIVPYWSSGLYELLGYDPLVKDPTINDTNDLFHHEDRERLQGL